MPSYSTTFQRDFPRMVLNIDEDDHWPRCANSKFHS